MIQKLKRLLGIENYEEALHSFSSVVEQAEMLKAEIDAMAKEYISTSRALNSWLSQEKNTEAIELIKGQQDGLTSRYLSFLAGKQSEYKRLEGEKKSYIIKHPGFEKALVDLKKSDFVDNTLDSYRQGQYTLAECDMIIKAATKEKVQYADNIVFNQCGEILIVQRGPLDTNGANLWVLPGGHRKMNEDPCKAAIRELSEETGYTADEAWPIGVYDDDTCHIDYFISMIDTAEQEPVVDANETRHTAFVPVTKLYDYPTMHDIWDKVYDILGIAPNVVKIKKAITEGIIKNSTAAETIVNTEIRKAVDGEEKKKKKFKKVMDEWKSGTLKSGSGDKVMDQKQAIAIALSVTGQSKEKAFESEIIKAEEKLTGGKADNKTLEQIAKKHKVDIEDLVKQYKKGLRVEHEHSENDEEAGEIAKDHLWEDAEYYDKLEKIEPEEKSIQPTIQKMVRTKWPEEIEGMSEFEKAKALGHLIPKKVQIKGKDGKVHLAIRWVNPETGEGEKYSEGLKEDKKITAETFEDTVAGVASSNLTKADKLRNLIDLGIYDTKLLTLLSGHEAPGGYLKKLDIDLKALPDNSETILKEVRREQENNDTPEDLEKNLILGMRSEEEIDVLWHKYEDDMLMVAEDIVDPSLEATGAKLVVAYGGGGVGKTYKFTKLAKRLKLREYNKEAQPNKLQYDYVKIGGKISPSQVYAEMYRHRDKLLVFDDCDSFIKDKDGPVQGYLKVGLDTGESTRISNLTPNKMYMIPGNPDSGLIPNQFDFTGRMIIITNLSARDFDRAIFSRGLTTNLVMTMDETLRQLNKIKDDVDILSADKSTVVLVPPEARALAYDTLVKYKDKIGDLMNIRTFYMATISAARELKQGRSRESAMQRIVLDLEGKTGEQDERIRMINKKK